MKEMLKLPDIKLASVRIKLSSWHSSFQLKCNKETSEMNYIIEQVDLTDIYIILHPKDMEHTYSL